MAVTVKSIIPPKQAETVQTTQYTAVNCKTVIDKFTITNNTAANVTISVNLVTTGDTPGIQNRIINARAIAPSEAYTCPELVGQSMEPGGTISTIAGSAAALTISASGREITGT